MLQVARGPATAHISATVHGGTEAVAVYVAEQLALRFCDRVDRALEYTAAQNHRVKPNGATVWCRRVPGGALVGDLAAFCDAIAGEMRASRDGATVVSQAGGHDLWLKVGLTTAQIEKDTSRLRFPPPQRCLRKRLVETPRGWGEAPSDRPTAGGTGEPVVEVLARGAGALRMGPA